MGPSVYTCPEFYSRLLKLCPGEIVASTLYIDLVWHSAMLTPAAYREY